MHDIFYFTDVHGQLDLFQSMRDWCYKQDPECTIVYGGDACDRGEFGYDIMESLIEDPQVVYIRGNHEDMFIRACRELITNHPDIKNRMLTIKEAKDLLTRESWLHWVHLSIRNGGRSTLKDWLTNGSSVDFINQLEQRMCYTYSLDNGICITHAGGTQEAFMRVSESEYNNEVPDRDDAEEVIWDRNYLASWWDKDKIIIHGHTPTCYIHDYVYGAPRIRESEMTPIAYKPHTKGEEVGLHIAMDTGMTFYGHGYVLNCLTGEAQHFFDPDVGKLDSKRPIQILENIKLF